MPLFAVDLFAQPVFSLSIVASVTSFVAQTVAYVALPFLFQNVLGRTPFATGLLMLPWLVARRGDGADRRAAFGPLRAGAARRVRHAGAWPPGCSRSCCCPRTRRRPTWCGAWPLCGIGYGFFQSPNNRTILGGAPRERTGAAQGILATARLVGQTLGAALVALVFGALLEPGRTAMRSRRPARSTSRSRSRSRARWPPRSRARFAAPTGVRRRQRRNRGLPRARHTRC